MKVENHDLGPVMMRSLSCDKIEVIEEAVVEHMRDGWRAGTIYSTTAGKAYVSMFKWNENKKPLRNHCKII